LKLLHITNSTTPAGGGPIESILQAHRVLNTQGHSFEIVCVDSPDSPWLSELPIKTTALGPPWTAYRYSPQLEPWLRREATRFDAVILHGVWLHTGFATWHALRRGPTPYFVYTHGLLDPVFRKVFPFRHIKKSISWALNEHRVVRDARAVFFTCEEERHLAARSFKPYRANARIVPYCVGSPPGDPEAQKRTFLKRFPQLAGKNLVLFLSRIHPKKGCDLLIDAFAKVAADTSLHLVMAGPDPIGWRKSLEDKARGLGLEERITWTGMLSGDLKWGAFRSADVFVLPSHQENFGIAIVEALACGVPVLTTHKVNIWREIIEDGGGIAAAESAEGATELLAKWVTLSPSQRDTMREKALSCFTTRFRAAEAAATLLKTLRECGVKG